MRPLDHTSNGNLGTLTTQVRTTQVRTAQVRPRSTSVANLSAYQQRSGTLLQIREGKWQGERRI